MWHLSLKGRLPFLRGLPEPSSQWELMETIGSGTFGEVFKGRDFNTGKIAAVKVMVCESAKEIELEMELTMLRDHCVHRCLPEFYGAFVKENSVVTKDELWLIMEFCSSGAVSRLAKDLLALGECLEEDIIAFILKETLLAIQFLHHRKIIHRDVKGGNILMTHDGRIKLVDFGVCAQLKEDMQRRNTSIGTPFWMAPEVIACEHYLEAEYDVRCDVWSFGITAIELGDAHPPLHDTDVNQVVFAIPRSPPPKLRRPEQWSDSFNSLIAFCLVKDFEKRPMVANVLEHPFLKDVPENTKAIRHKLMSIMDHVKGIEHDKSEGKDTVDGPAASRFALTGGELVDDLATLEYLDENSLVKQLRKRYSKDIIYTNLGDILLAINPFRPLPIYTSEFANRYRLMSHWQDEPPHVFTVSHQCYHNLTSQQHNQCCVVSGESGAGKTETAKFLVQQLTRLGKAVNQNLEQRILQVNPLFEAFGNACTVMNENSSRFGKYLTLFFLPTGHIVGAQTSQYLLESSRVIFQAAGERNFHIFYYLYAGLGEEGLLQHYHLRNLYQHRYLRSSRRTGVAEDGEKCRKAFKDVKRCLDIIGFTETEVENVMHILVAILHIGDISLEVNEQASRASGQEAASVVNKDIIPVVSHLLGIGQEDILLAITTTVVALKGETIVRTNSIQLAEDCRDAMAKSLYSRLFSWLVRRCNKQLEPKNRQNNKLLEIGILDIFGFEDFKKNSSEQLFINITNEQMQFFFNHHVFALEQEEYEKEGIPIKSILFVDNSDCLKMLLQKPVGLLALLDEESRFPRATDASLINKLHSHLNDSKYYKRPLNNALQFSVIHYAGKVTYQAEGFLEKNRNTVPSKLIELLQQSGNPLVRLLFEYLPTNIGTFARRASVTSLAPRKMPMRRVVSTATLGQQSTARHFQTAAWNFNNSLQDLLTHLFSATPHFVRCIKPNRSQVAGQFVREKVLEQLRYTGVLETVRIRQQGFAHRILFSDFIARYKILAYQMTESVPTNGASCEKVAKHASLESYAIGRTKIFLRYYHLEQLSTAKQKFSDAAVCLQRIVRGWLAHRAYQQRLAKWKRSIIVLQSAIRGWLCRQHFLRQKQRLLRAAIAVQSFARGLFVRRQLVEMRKARDAAMLIQATIRGWLQRRRFAKLLAQRQVSSIIIQSHVLGWLCRLRYWRLKNRRHREACVKIQKAVRGYQARRQLQRLREEKVKLEVKRLRAAVCLQKWTRGWLARLMYRQLCQKRSAAAQLIQKNYRKCVAQRRARALRKEKLKKLAEQKTLDEDNRKMFLEKATRISLKRKIAIEEEKSMELSLVSSHLSPPLSSLVEEVISPVDELGVLVQELRSKKLTTQGNVTRNSDTTDGLFSPNSTPSSGFQSSSAFENARALFEGGQTNQFVPEKKTITHRPAANKGKGLLRRRANAFEQMSRKPEGSHAARLWQSEDVTQARRSQFQRSPPAFSTTVTNAALSPERLSLDIGMQQSVFSQATGASSTVKALAARFGEKRSPGQFSAWKAGRAKPLLVNSSALPLDFGKRHGNFIDFSPVLKS